MMNTSMKFKFIEENLMKILTLILTNQNILRYVKYMQNNPLDPRLPNIEEFSLLNSNIIPAPFDENTLSETEVKLFLYPYSGKLNSRPLGTHTYELDIVCPIKHWILEGLGQFRTVRIADEIAKMIDQQLGIGIGELKIPEYRAGRVASNNSYALFTLWLEVDTATIKGK